MSLILVERYLTAHDPAALVTAVRLDRRVASLMLAAGCSMRFVRSIYVRDDNTSLTLFEAPSVETVRTALTEAGIVFHRIGLAVDVVDEDVEEGLTV